MGTILLQFTPINIIELFIPLFLLIVLIYYILSSKINNTFKNKVITPNHKKFLISGSFIGFYNGFFGPGTGSIWSLVLMRIFRINLQKATIYAKPLNLCGNLTALSIFIIGVKINYSVAIVMSIGSFLGGQIGANFIIYKDLKVLKLIFLICISLSTAGTVYKYWF